MPQNKKILFVLESYFPLRRAGTEIYVKDLIPYLTKTGFTIDILISSTDTSQEEYFFEGCRVYVIHISEKLNLKELNGIKPPSGFDQFKMKLRASNPDIVHFHSFGRAINSFHLQWVKESGIKTVFTNHQGGLFCVKGNYLLFEREVCDGRVIESRCLSCYAHYRGIPRIISDPMRKLILFDQFRVIGQVFPQTQLIKHKLNEIQRLSMYCDAIIAIAPWIMKKFEINGITEKVNLVEQGIEVAANVRDYIRNQNKTIIVGFIGRMNPSKGFHLLREAVEGIEGSGPELKVYTLTSPDDTEYYLENREWAQSKNNVSWTENMDHASLMSEIEHLDLLIVPSISNEVAPLVILEAFQARVPVLGSSYPGITDLIVHDVNGQIFRNNDVHDMKEKLTAIINHPEILALWSDNIKKVRHKMDIARDMINIYNSLE